MAADTPEISVFPTNEAIARAASFFVDRIAAADGEVSVCLTGGDEARRLYEWIAAHELDRIPWTRVHWFWSDERFVAPDDPLSNQAMARESFLNAGAGGSERMHPIPTLECSSPEEAAARYDAELQAWRARREAGGKLLFDFVLHGLGPDGHTASLFPGQALVDVRDRHAVGVETAGFEPFTPRVSLTLSALNESSAALMFVLGEKKCDAVTRVLSGEDLPAGRLRSYGPMPWIVDEAAAPPLARQVI